jgi:hypothetical protein
VTLRAHVLVVVATAVIVAAILRLLYLRQLRSKYALVWLCLVVAMVPFVVFPTLLQDIADVVGVKYGTTVFLLFGVAFLFLVVVHFSWELSRLEMRSRSLAEEVALLRTELTTSSSAGRGDSGEVAPG